MKIIFIAPLPPPYNGQSLVAKVFHDFLIKGYEVEVINLNKKSHKDGIDSLNRIWEIIKVLTQVFIKHRNADIIYLHISESLAGNIRDLLIYSLSFSKLNKLYIHLHGGSIKKWVFDKHRNLRKFNFFFLNKIGGVIISGKSHIEIFDGILDQNKVHIIPNFAEDELFVDDAEFESKFLNFSPIKVLYLSNLIRGKGYEYLVKAFKELEADYKNKIEIVFAGGFETNNDKEEFLKQIQPYAQLHYKGFIQGEEKRKLLKEAQVFCFPSYLHEGQPVSILEAYAAGCCVITTGKSGISDIFSDGENGYKFNEKSSESLCKTLENVVDNPGELYKFGKFNLKEARLKYKVDIYNSELEKIIKN